MSPDGHELEAIAMVEAVLRRDVEAGEAMLGDRLEDDEYGRMVGFASGMALCWASAVLRVKGVENPPDAQVRAEALQLLHWLRLIYLSES